MILALTLPDEMATSDLGGWLARHMQRGETLLLEGPIGAGKSHLARAFIRARLGRAEDVPSPTFTLVQVYEADTDIWHADLYRLTHPDEVLELGLDDAFERAICLVEWPDRLGSALPERAVRVALRTEGDGRVAVVSGNLPWMGALARECA